MKRYGVIQHLEEVHRPPVRIHVPVDVEKAALVEVAVLKKWTVLFGYTLVC